MIDALLLHPWAVLNIILSFIVAGVGTYMVIAYGDEISLLERGGVCVMAGNAALTIGPIVMRNVFDSHSPYDDWSAALMRAGAAMALVGWMWRRDRTRWAIFWLRIRNFVFPNMF